MKYISQAKLKTGKAMLRIDSHGLVKYVHTAVPWNGVSACRFATDHVARGIGAVKSDALNDALLQWLEGDTAALLTAREALRRSRSGGCVA